MKLFANMDWAQITLTVCAIIIAFGVVWWLFFTPVHPSEKDDDDDFDGFGF